MEMVAMFAYVNGVYHLQPSTLWLVKLSLHFNLISGMPLIQNKSIFPIISNYAVWH
jgi:hypothetical protein